jgi:hypothetical protein
LNQQESGDPSAVVWFECENFKEYKPGNGYFCIETGGKK